MRNLRPSVLALVLLALAPVALDTQARPPDAAAGSPTPGQRSPRDPGRAVQPTGTASISGRVLAADTGRPLKRARVTVSSSAGGRSRVATTDESGRYVLEKLPAGTYLVRATRTGFVDGAYGQRRALREGIPLQVGEGQQLANIDFSLARGGVISGHVLDEDGEPLARATVQVLRHQYVRGERRLLAAGGDQTDDRGQYRIFGLPPGAYIVSATAGGMDNVVRRAMLIEPRPLAPGNEDNTESTGYAPTYYPGVITTADAARVSVAPAQELTGIDFQLQLVPLATVRGTTTDPRGMVVLVPQDGAMIGRPQALRSAVHVDGSFTIANVPPGSYMAVARADGADGPTMTAIQPVMVSGEDIHITLSPVKGARLAGTVTFESAAAAPKAFSGIRISAVPLASSALLPGRAARPVEADDSGRFTIADLPPGRYVVHGSARSGWTVKAVYLDGRDVTDQPLEFRGGESASGLNVVFTDRLSDVSGIVTAREGNGPAAGTTVIAFPADERLWAAMGRRIRTARVDQTGAYRIDSLPPGDYVMLATDDVEPGEWFDPAFLDAARPGGVRVTIHEGEQKTQALKAS